jgi:hypothetical protein
MLLGKEICTVNVTDAVVRREWGSESIVELVAGAAVVGLTILGLAEVSPTFLVTLATIVFGASLLLQRAAALSPLNVVLARYSSSEAGLGAISSGWPPLFVARAAGIVLGILALLDVSSMQLVALALIAFGASLLTSNQINMRIRILETPANAGPTLTPIVGDFAAGTTCLQTMAGLAAIVLGILALSGLAPTKLTLIALLELGCFSSLTSAVIAGTFMRAFPLSPHHSPADDGWSGGHCPRHFGGIIRTCAPLEPDDFEPDKCRHLRSVQEQVPPGAMRIGSRVATTPHRVAAGIAGEPCLLTLARRQIGLANEVGDAPPYPTRGSL